MIMGAHRAVRPNGAETPNTMQQDNGLMCSPAALQAYY